MPVEYMETTPLAHEGVSLPYSPGGIVAYRDEPGVVEQDTAGTDIICVTGEGGQ